MYNYMLETTIINNGPVISKLRQKQLFIPLNLTENYLGLNYN